MSISFKDLREATGGMVENFVGPAELKEFKTSAEAISLRLHPTMDEVFASIERTLNNFGFTLGELDNESEGDYAPEGNENYFILSKANQDIIRNAYITISWETVSAKHPNGQVSVDAMDNVTSLHFKVKVKFIEVSPAELDRVLNDTLSGYELASSEEEYEDMGDSESEQNLPESVQLDEAYRVIRLNRQLTIVSDKGSLNFTVETTGNLELTVQDEAGQKTTVIIPKIKATDTMQAIQDHFVKYTE